jgi:hypothetical protein
MDFSFTPRGQPAGAGRESKSVANCQVVTASVLALLSGAPALRAEEVRCYNENGITYQETRRTVRERVPAKRYEERHQTSFSSMM